MRRRRRPVRPRLPDAAPPEWDLALRRESRARALRWGLNALVIALLLGVPYARGQMRARETQATYARAAACMYGGAPAPEPSAVGQVRDPSGHYAAMFLERPDDWPARCEGTLRDLAREPADLVLPSVKAAEADVQKAAQLTLRELSGMPEASDRGAQVPLRPLWGLQLLRTAVEANASAAGASVASGDSAVTFSARASTAPTPTLLDVDADIDATLEVWGGDTELEVAAFDRRGVSYVRLLPDAITRARLPRAANLRSVVRQGAAAYLVWTTAPDKCGLTGCAGRSMGLAPMPVPLTTLPEPRWVAAHPFGSPKRSLAFEGTRMWIAAANLHGSARLVELSNMGSSSGDAEPRAPLPVTTLLDRARDLVVFTDAEGLGALSLRHGDDARWELWRHTGAGDERRVATWTTASATAWLRTCATRDAAGVETRFFLVGSSDEVRVGSMRDGRTRTWPALQAAIPAPPRVDRDPRVALACDHDRGVTLAFVDDAGALQAVSCRDDQTPCALHPIAEQATAVAVTHTDRDVLIAYSGAPEQPQVRLRRLGQGGTDAHTEALVPGPCWERWGGMCGEPTLGWAGARLILTARSGRALMALQSTDAGARWSELGATNVVKPPPPHVLPPGLAR